MRVLIVLCAAGCGGNGGGAHDGGSRSDGSPSDAATSSDGAASDGGLLDAMPPPRLWVAYLADAVTDEQFELFVVDIESGIPGEAFRVNDDLVSSSVSDGPQWSPDGRTILYHAAQDVLYTHELFAASLASSGPSTGVKIHPPQESGDHIAANSGADNGYDWSPDGTRIRFHGRFGDEEIGIYTVDAAAPGIATRVNPLPEHAVINLRDNSDWSPDSHTLLYQVFEPGENLYAVDVAAARPGAPARINPDPEVAGGRVVPSHRGIGFWSPDGSKILYRGTLDDPDKVEIYVTSFAGGVPGATHKVNDDLVTGGNVTDGFSAPFWSPDGTKVLYRADQEVDDRFDLYVVDMTSAVPGPAQRVNHILERQAGVEDNAFIGGDYFAWSPDSTRVIYHEAIAQHEYLAGHLWVVDVTGPAPGTPQRIRVNGGIVPLFAWSPDSSRLVFSRRITLAAFMVDLSGGTPGAPQPVGGDLGLRSSTYQWSPDSTRLALQTALEWGGPRELWLTSAAAPDQAVLVSAPLVEFGSVVWEVRWSADSQRLVYQMRAPPHREIHLVDLSDGAPAPAVRINGPTIDEGNVASGQYWIQPVFSD